MERIPADISELAAEIFYTWCECGACHPTDDNAVAAAVAQARRFHSLVPGLVDAWNTNSLQEQIALVSSTEVTQ